MPPSSSSSSYELCRHHRRCALACVRVIVTACGACTHAVTKAALRNAACAPAQDYCRPLPAAAINLVRSPWMPACLSACNSIVVMASCDRFCCVWRLTCSCTTASTYKSRCCTLYVLPVRLLCNDYDVRRRLLHIPDRITKLFCSVSETLLVNACRNVTALIMPSQ